MRYLVIGRGFDNSLYEETAAVFMNMIGINDYVLVNLNLRPIPISHFEIYVLDNINPEEEDCFLDEIYMMEELGKMFFNLECVKSGKISLNDVFEKYINTEYK